MIVIIEGLDNSGKSTLCRHYHENVNLTIVKPIPRKSPEEALIQTIQLLSIPVDVVFDRINLISEAVYGPTIRSTKFPEELFEVGIQALIDVHATIVHCCADPEPWGDRAQMDGVINNWIRLNERYFIVMEILRQAGIPVKSHDWKNP